MAAMHIAKIIWWGINAIFCFYVIDISMVYFYRLGNSLLLKQILGFRRKSEIVHDILTGICSLSIFVQYVWAQYTFSKLLISIVMHWYFWILLIVYFSANLAFVFHLNKVVNFLSNRIKCISYSVKLKRSFVKLWLVAHRNINRDYTPLFMFELDDGWLTFEDLPDVSYKINSPMGHYWVRDNKTQQTQFYGSYNAFLTGFKG